MKRNVILDNNAVGCQKPLICVPIVGANLDILKQEIEMAKSTLCDVLEWRVDFYEGDIFEVLGEISSLIKPKNLLLTFRTKAQGGEKDLENYGDFIKKVIATKKVDMVDIELVCGNKLVQILTDFAKENSVISVVSEHFFTYTPSDVELEKIYETMQNLGGDIPKLAVMPNDFTDVCRFMNTVYKVSRENSPIIGISMSGMGAVSRICSKHMGSCLSFAVSGKASAPGQLSSALVNEIMDNI